MAELSRIRLYPVKALDGVEVDAVEVVGDGRLRYDRAFAMFDADGEYVNARNEPAVHRLDADFDLEAGTVRLRDDEGRRYDGALERLDEDPELEAWLSDFFGEPVTVARAAKSNFTDSAGGLAPYRISANGPSVVGATTLEEVASWYADLTVGDLRRRLRANVEVSGVPPFWEDRLFADADRAVEWTAGDVTLYGTMCKPRCVTPTRDPDTGEAREGFTSRFVEKRRETFPEWADPGNLGHHIEYEGTEHYYYLTVVTRVPATETGRTLAVGDGVAVGGETPLLRTL